MTNDVNYRKRDKGRLVTGEWSKTHVSVTQTSLSSGEEE